VHLQPYYQGMGFKNGEFPNAEAYYRAAISLPIYFGLTEDEQDYVIDQISFAIC
jgi:dTDP-4-amino-4,6-dideoxygalactose transaminase